MEKLLVFAVPFEAEATIQLLEAEQQAPDFYTFSGGAILISGMGVHQAQSAVAPHILHFDEVWNLGLAGALTTDLELFELVSIGQVTKYVPIEDLDAHSLNVMKRVLPTLELEGEMSLATSDFPIHMKKHRPPFCSLVDMEGYGIAHLAKTHGKRCRIWKIVSDFASPGGFEAILKNQKEHSKRLAKKVEDESSCD